jgi:hypothetical protein
VKSAECERSRFEQSALTPRTALFTRSGEGYVLPEHPQLDQMPGPAKSTKEVLETPDGEYRKAGKPRVWFLPLNEPITPHLDELPGRVEATEKK